MLRFPRALFMSPKQIKVAEQKDLLQRQLRKAIEGNYPNLVSLAVKRGANVDCIDHSCPWKDCPLMTAVRCNNVEMIELLARLRVNLAERIDLTGRTALHKAARTRGSEPLLRSLIAVGAACDKQNFFGETPLMDAADIGHWGNVSVLLPTQSLNSANENGETALMKAVAGNDFKVERAAIALRLMDCGASVNARDCCGKTALEKARNAGNEMAVEVLKQYGAQE